MEKLYAMIDELTPAYVQFWKEICMIETPSHDKAAVDTLVDKLEAHAKALGISVYREAFEKAGDCLRLDLPGDESKQPIVLMAHMDTVHEKGAFGPEIVTLKDGILYGPGVNDCKNGIAASMLMLDAFVKSGVSHPPIRVLYTSDEEISARLSGKQGVDFFATHAEGCKAALNCESGSEGSLVVGRKGIGNVLLQITGKAAHAGAGYYKGASAVREAAHKILAIEALSEPDGCTFNCGVVVGGTKTNIVPEACTIQLDIRAKTVQGMDEALEKVKRIAEHSYVEGTSCTMSIASIRPPMEATEANYALIARINELAAELGMAPMKPVVNGGGSDAAYTTRMGIPTVCSIGPCGWDVHTVRERSDIASLPVRTKLIAKCVCEL